MATIIRTTDEPDESNNYHYTVKAGNYHGQTGEFHSPEKMGELNQEYEINTDNEEASKEA